MLFACPFLNDKSPSRQKAGALGWMGGHIKRRCFMNCAAPPTRQSRYSRYSRCDDCFYAASTCMNNSCASDGASGNWQLPWAHQELQWKKYKKRRCITNCAAPPSRPTRLPRARSTRAVYRKIASKNASLYPGALMGVTRTPEL